MQSDSTPLFTNEPIDLSALPTLDRQEFVPLHPRYLRVMRIYSVLGTFVLVGGAVALHFINREIPLWGIILSVAGILLMGGVHQLLLSRMFEVRGYLFRRQDLTYRKGLILRKEVTFPFSRMQYVSISQSVIDRLFSMHTLNVHNASGALDSQLSIPGLTYDEAQKYKEMLLDFITQGGSESYTDTERSE